MKNEKISAAKDLDLRILEKLKRIGMGKLCVINKKAIKIFLLQIGNEILYSFVKRRFTFMLSIKYDMV